MNLQTLPAVIKRRIPHATHVANYRAAQVALTNCANVDEVLKIRATAEAAAIYAKQILDNSLFDTASRIKLRAERRLGELLDSMKSPPSQADLSYLMQNRARSLAKIPEARFEQKIQQSPVPTAAKLALEHRKETGTFKPNVGARGRRDANALLADIKELTSDLEDITGLLSYQEPFYSLKDKGRYEGRYALEALARACLALAARLAERKDKKR